MSDELREKQETNKLEKKPRPPLTEKQKENLRRGREMNTRGAVGRENARIRRVQTGVINKYNKEQEKINREKEYNRIMAEKNAKLAPEEKEEKPLQKLQKSKPKPKPEPESESEDEEEVIIKKPIAKKPITEEQLYSKANIEMLRNKLYQQTRQRLKNDMFNY